MRIVPLFLLLVSACVYAAEPEETLLGKLTYRMTDVLAKKQAESVWRFFLAKDGAVKVKKEIPFGSINEVEVDTRRVTRYGKEGFYLREVFFLPNGRLQRGEVGIGHLEKRDIQTDEIIFKQPMFFRLSIEKSVLQMEFKVFMSDGKIQTTTRTFVENRELSPLREQVTITSMSGVVESDVIFTLQSK